MNSIEEKICSAIDIIVQRAISQANYDRTIQATVVTCVDATIGKYTVRYQDSTFYAYSGNSEVTYSSGSNVYVLVPGNNMSEEKTILGTTEKLGINYISTIEKDAAYEIVGSNCINSENTFELSSYYKDRKVKILYHKNNAITANEISLDITAVEQYIKNSNTIICGAKIRTELPAEQQYRGDYGIIFALNFTDNATDEIVTRYYIVDVDQMTGNPYKMLYDTRQYGIFDIDGTKFIDVEYICIFSDNFPNSKPDNQCISDIFIKDIELMAAERLSEEDINSYVLTFITPRGTYFDGKSLDSDNKSIQAQVRVKGKVVDNESQKLPFYWFVEHSGITSQSQYYNKYGGQGWKCLNEYNLIKEESSESAAVVEWIPASAEHIVKKIDIIAKEVKYKCAVVYDGTVISKTIVIKNLGSNYDIQITSDSGTKFYFDSGFPTLTCLINGEENKSYTYSWAEINNVGYFQSIPETSEDNTNYNNVSTMYEDLLNKIEKETILYESNKATLENLKKQLDGYDKITRVEKNKIYNLNVGKITNFSTYYCTVYYNSLYLGTASITLTNSLESEGTYSLVINNGSYTYKYNENGISPANGSVEDPIDISSLTFTIYNNLGDEIEEELAKKSEIKWVVPYRDTLLIIPDDYVATETNENDGTKMYDNVSSLSYKIEDKFDLNKTNNNIKLLVNYKGVSLSAITDLTFVKEGQSGTNGTDFTCKIVPNVPSGIIPPKYPLITQLNNGTWAMNYTPKEANKFFKVQLWHNEIKILDSNVTSLTTENKEAKISWSILQNKYTSGVTDSSSLSIDEGNGTVTFSGYKTDAPANIVKATVTYDNVVYYATISVLTVKLNDNNYRVALKDSTGFTSALFTSDGQRPKYSTNPFELIVLRTINGYQEDISLKESAKYSVVYKWNYKGRLYEDKAWIDSINLADDKTIEDLKKNQKAVKPLDSFDGQCVTNALEGVIYYSGTEVARIHIPIHLLLNRYGNSAINDWDGNSVNIDTNGGFILAPQVGAGIKETDNSFTGVLMGKVKEADSSKEDIGLLGYYKGVRSIFLDSKTGKAQFGSTGKSQIILDPSSDKAQLYSGNYSTKDKTGMLIDLTTPEIRYGSGNFIVNSSGHATIKGGGTIAGWSLTDTELYSPATYTKRTITLDSANKKFYSNLKTAHNNSADGFYLDSQYLVLGSKFKVFADGRLEIGTGAYNSSTSKRWTINGDTNDSYIKYGAKGTTGSVYIGTSDIQLGKGFSVDANGLLKVGNLTGRYWCIAGKTNSSTANAFMSYNHPVTYDENGILSNYPTINSNHNASSVYVGTDGIAIGSYFKIKSDNTGFLISYKTEALDPVNSSGVVSYPANSFYLSTDGLRLGNRLKYTASAGMLEVGLLNANSRRWTIGGVEETLTNGSKIVNSYIKYGEKLRNYSVYLGTDGLYIGSRFQIGFDKNNNQIFRIAYNANSLAASPSYNSFYLGTDGLSIGNKLKFTVGSTATSTLLEVGNLSSSRHWIINGDSNNSYIAYGTKGNYNSVYLGTDGLYIGSKFFIGPGANSTAGSNFKIAYNTEKLSDSQSNSFYLSTDGFRIGNKLRFTASTGALELGYLSGNHWTIGGESDKSYLLYGTQGKSNSVYLGTDGLYIGSRFKILANGSNPMIAYNTDALEPKNEAGVISYPTPSFYLSIDGFRIGNRFKVDRTGVLETGYLPGVHWTINGDLTRSYITYGKETTDVSFVPAGSGTEGNKVYLGTDGISLGNQFSVDNSGNFIAKRGLIGGLDFSDQGIGNGADYNSSVVWIGAANANIYPFKVGDSLSIESWLPGAHYDRNRREFCINGDGFMACQEALAKQIRIMDGQGKEDGVFTVYGKAQKYSYPNHSSEGHNGQILQYGNSKVPTVMRTGGQILCNDEGVAIRAIAGVINFYEPWMPSGSALNKGGKVCQFQLNTSFFKDVLFSNPDGAITTNVIFGGNCHVTFKGNVYDAGGGIIHVSDKKLKKSIHPLNIEESANFIYSLTPSEFKFNEGTSDRYHHGLIADQVKDVMKKDWGLYIEYKQESSNMVTKGLRYEELIADLIATVQQQNKRITQLESEMKRRIQWKN